MRKIKKNSGTSGKVKMLSRKRRRSIEKEATQNAVATSSSTVGIFGRDIVCDILSRLPAKSIMRFKCVSKYWYSLTEDSYFRDLHFNRSSKTSQHLLFIVPPLKKPKYRITGISYDGDPVCFKIADALSEGRGRVISTIQTMRKSKYFEFSSILAAVHGLVCFIAEDEDAVCIFNISTREVTPWIEFSDDDEYLPFAYGFGFDPSTKEYKVICIWEVSEEENSVIYAEVLTLGDDSWRRIDEVPSLPLGFGFGFESPSVYVNGFIYWLPDMYSESCNWEDENGNWKDAFILAVDVGSEKFKKIRIFESIIDQCLEGRHSLSLLERPLSSFGYMMTMLVANIRLLGPKIGTGLNKLLSYLVPWVQIQFELFIVIPLRVQTN